MRRLTCTVRKKLLERVAAGSLMLVIILPPLFLALIYGFESSRMRVMELDYLRARKAAGELALTAFEPDLWHDFRLWAGGTPPDLAPARKLLPELLGNQTDISVQGKDPALEPEALQRMIVQQMKLRLPLVVMEEVDARTRLFHRQSRELSMYADSREFEMPEDQREFIEGLQEDDLDDFIAAEAEEGGNPELLEQLYLAKEALGYFGQDLDDYKFHLLSECEAADSEDLETRPLSALQHVSSWTRSYEQAMLSLPLDKPYLVEYVLRYFPAHVTQRKKDGRTTRLRRPDGVSLERVADKYGENLCECLLTGKPPDKGKRAVKQVTYYITTLRVATHHAAKLADPKESAKYGTRAAAISTVVAVVTLGHVTIQPEILKQLLIAIAAAKAAVKDVKKLKKGEGVDLWPGGQDTQNIEVYYHDFLRVFFYVKTRPATLANIQSMLQEFFPNARYASYQVTGRFKDRVHTHTVRYDTRELADVAP